jgi:nucleoside transporter
VAGLLVGAIAGAAETALPMQLAGGVYILLGLYSFTLPDTRPRAKGERINIAALFGLDIIAGYRDRPFWIFIGTMFVLMLPKCFYDTYANTFFVEKNLAISIAGLRFEATAIQTAGQMFESLFLIALPFLLTRMGIKRVLVLGMGAWAVRFVAFAYGYQGSAAIVPLMLFGIIIHGICYDFVFVSSQIYVDRKFDPSARARAQSFLALVTQGIGTVAGSNIAGMIYAAHTASPIDHDWRAIWAVPAIVAFIAMLIFALAFRERADRTTGVNTAAAGGAGPL